MASVNKAIVLGRLGADPELRQAAGKSVTALKVATSEVWKDGEGNRQEKTEWHTVNVWGSMADTCVKYLSKGSQVYVEGRIATRKWQDKDGRDRYSTEIVADRVQFLGSKGDKTTAGDDAGVSIPPADKGSDEDNLPF